jgi:zinc protease
VTPEAGFALAERVFGDWVRPASRLPTRAPARPAAARPRVVVVDLPGAGQASVSVSKRTVAYSDLALYPAQVANGVLGGGYSARLNKEIRIDRGLSYGAGSGVDLRRDAGLFRAAAQTKNESAGEVAGLLLEQMGKLGTAPVEAVELTPRATTLTGERARALESNAGVAAELAELALYGVPLGELDRYASSVQSVTPTALQRFARTELDPKAANVVIVGDSKLFIDDVRRRFPSVEVIPAAELDLNTATLRKAG